MVASVSTMLALRGYSPRLASGPLRTYWSSVKPTVSVALGLLEAVFAAVLLPRLQATASIATASTRARFVVRTRRKVAAFFIFVPSLIGRARRRAPAGIDTRVAPIDLAPSSPTIHSTATPPARSTEHGPDLGIRRREGFKSMTSFFLGRRSASAPRGCESELGTEDGIGRDRGDSQGR